MFAISHGHGQKVFKRSVSHYSVQYTTCLFFYNGSFREDFNTTEGRVEKMFDVMPSSFWKQTSNNQYTVLVLEVNSDETTL